MTKITDNPKVLFYKEIGVALLVFAVVFAALLFVLNSSRSMWQSQVTARANELATTQALSIERNLKGAFSAAYILGTLVQRDSGQLKSFDYLAQSLIDTHKSVSNLQLAPDGIVQHVYPLAGSEKAIGHNILKDDKRTSEALRAIKSHKMTLAGPFNLVQGGVAIVARQPVFLSNKVNWKPKAPSDGEQFWGFTSSLIYLQDVIDMSDLHNLEEKGYQYQIWRLHPDSGEVDVFAGSTEIPPGNRVRQEINLPNSTWYLEIVKTGLQFSFCWIIGLSLLCLFLSLAIGHWVYTLLSRGRKLHLLVNKRTKQLSLANKTLQKKQLDLLKLTNAVEQTASAVVITDIDGIIEYVNPRFTFVTGYTPAEVIGHKTSILRSSMTKKEVHKELWQTLWQGKSWSGELHNKQKNGHLYWSKITISPVKNERSEIVNFVGVSEDITEAKKERQRIQKLAFNDPLTGCPNRRLFVTRLEQSIKSVRRTKKPAALFFIDLDKFKQINDQFGHEGGDKLLIEIARRLESAIRESDMVARIGGDEFILLLSEVSNRASAEDIADKILRNIREKFEVKQQSITPTISIGITLICPDGNYTSDQIIAHADTALYQAKKAGKNTHRFFMPEKA